MDPGSQRKCKYSNRIMNQVLRGLWSSTYTDEFKEKPEQKRLAWLFENFQDSSVKEVHSSQQE